MKFLCISTKRGVDNINTLNVCSPYLNKYSQLKHQKDEWVNIPRYGSAPLLQIYLCSTQHYIIITLLRDDIMKAIVREDDPPFVLKFDIIVFRLEVGILGLKFWDFQLLLFLFYYK